MEFSIPYHVQCALFTGFLTVVTVFLYSEKMKFDPPKGLELASWRFVYGGGALLFASATAFAALGPEQPEGLALQVFGSMLAGGVASMAFGFLLRMVRPTDRGDDKG